jgi:hypothetical protein
MGEWQRGESAQQLLNTLVFSQIFVPLNAVVLLEMVRMPVRL